MSVAWGGAEVMRLDQLLDDGERGEVRRRLIVAAVTAFSARGYHATTTRDISRAAGMSSAAMYVHFASKEEVLFEASQAAHLAALEVVTDGIARAEGAPARLRAAVHAFTRWHAENTALARVAQYELAALSEEHYPIITALRREVQSALRDVVGEGVDSGEFTMPDFITTTRAIVSMGIDVSRWFDASHEITPTELADAYADTALRMVGAGA